MRPAVISSASKIHLSANNPFSDQWEKWRSGLETGSNKRRTSLAKIINLGKITKNQKVCEIGCGFGQYIIDLAATHSVMTYGVEYTRQYLEAVNQAEITYQIECHGICGDAVRLPLSTDSMDVVFSVSFFEHVYDIKAALREQLRVLKPEGKVIILISNLLSPNTFIRLFINYWFKSKGKHGGINWLFNKGKIRQNPYNVNLIASKK